SPSTMATFAPELLRPYCSSGPVHQALSRTAMPPVSRQPKKAAGHSGRLRMAMATRSPFFTPACCNAAVAHPLIAIDHKGLVAMRSRQPKEIAHGRRCIFPNPHAHAANIALLDFERRAGARQQRVGVRQGERGKLLAQIATPFTEMETRAQVCR